MSNTNKIIVFWLLIVVGYIFHSTYHLSGAIFGEDIKMNDATGQTPVVMHFFRIVLEILPLIMVVLTTYLSSRGFRLFSFVLAIVFGLANALHVVETAMHEIANISQIAVLSFILVVNILLILTLNNWRKEPSLS